MWSCGWEKFHKRSQQWVVYVYFNFADCWTHTSFKTCRIWIHSIVSPLTLIRKRRKRRAEAENQDECLMRGELLPQPDPLVQQRLLHRSELWAAARSKPGSGPAHAFQVQLSPERTLYFEMNSLSPPRSISKAICESFWTFPNLRFRLLLTGSLCSMKAHVIQCTRT